MGNYSNDKPIGKHVILTKNGEVEIKNYWFKWNLNIKYYSVLILKLWLLNIEYKIIIKLFT